MVQTAAELWRLHTVAGLPASGPSKPDKKKIAEWGTGLEAALTAALAGGGLIFPTRTSLYANLGYAANTRAEVRSDPIAERNGVYRKNGAVNAGSWTRIADLNDSVIRLTITGGTANAIEAAASPQVPSSPGNKIYLLTTEAANTTAVTIEVDSEDPAAIETPFGDALVANQLLPDVTNVLIWSVDGYRLLLPEALDADAILAAVLAAKADAELAASNAAANGNSIWPTRASIAAADIPGSTLFIWIARYATGRAFAPAPYIHGTSGGTLAVQDLNGQWWNLDTSGKRIELAWFGAIGGNDAIDQPAIAGAALVAGGGVLVWNPVATPYEMNAQVDILMNTTVLGYGKYISQCKAVDDTISIEGLFTCESGVTFEKCGFIGNNYTTVYNQAGAILCDLLEGAPDNIKGPVIRDCNFSNFKKGRWILVRNTSDKLISGGGLYDCEFVSASGNIADPGGPGSYSFAYNSAFVVAIGNAENSDGRIEGFQIVGNRAEGAYIKQFAILYCCTRNCNVDQNTLDTFGAVSDPDSACYAITLYNNYDSVVYAELKAGQPTGNSINGNRIHFGYDCGIYCADVADTKILGNIVTNCGTSVLTDPGANATLPKGGIVINGGTNVIIDDNNLIDNFVGIVALSQEDGITIGSGNRIKNNNTFGDGSYGIYVGPNSNSIMGATADVTIGAMHIWLDGAGTIGIFLRSRDDYPIGRIFINGPNIWAGRHGILGSNVETPFGLLSGPIKIENVKIGGPLSHSCLSIQDSASKIEISGRIDLGNTLTANGIDLQGSTNWDLFNIHFLNRDTLAATYCLVTNGGEGTQDGLRFTNVLASRRAGPSSVGLASPGWTAEDGAYVQYLTPGNIAAVDPIQDYSILGYRFTSAGNVWLQNRVTTGL